MSGGEFLGALTQSEHNSDGPFVPLRKIEGIFEKSSQQNAEHQH